MVWLCTLAGSPHQAADQPLTLTLLLPQGAAPRAQTTASGPLLCSLPSTSPSSLALQEETCGSPAKEGNLSKHLDHSL